MKMPIGLAMLVLGSLAWSILLPAAAMAGEVVVTVDASKRHQVIEGFGTCLVAWEPRFREMYRTEAFQRTYAQDLGMTMLRANLRGRVMPERVENWRDIRWQDFQFDERAAIFVEFGRALRENHHPDLKIIASVWSPPDWMKQNQHKNDTRSAAAVAHDYRGIDNRVKPEYYRHFAKWMVEMVKYYEHHGAPIHAVSIANEPQFTQTFESCVWNGPDYAEALALVGQMLEEEGFGHVKLFGPETMTSHFYPGGTHDYLAAIMEHEPARRHLDVFATHGYEEGVRAEMGAENMSRAWELASQHDLPFWITEGGTGGHDWPQPLHQGVATMYHNALVAGNASAIVPWQVSDGARNEHALMHHDRWTPKTWAAWHYSHFIRPGAVRIEASPSAYGDVAASAFLHEERNEIVLVLINASDEARELTVRFAEAPGVESFRARRTSADEQGAELDPVGVNGQSMSITMPPQSIATLAGQRSQDN
jgi:glucuronoarabinoxylan endo-1,4-beta-xylanase